MTDPLGIFCHHVLMAGASGLSLYPSPHALELMAYEGAKRHAAVVVGSECPERIVDFARLQGWLDRGGGEDEAEMAIYAIAYKSTSYRDLPGSVPSRLLAASVALLRAAQAIERGEEEIRWAPAISLFALP